jgi:hypothetical protein
MAPAKSYLKRMRRSRSVVSSFDSASRRARLGGANAHSSVSYNSETFRPMLPRTAATAKPTSKERTTNEPTPTTIQAHKDTVL